MSRASYHAEQVATVRGAEDKQERTTLFRRRRSLSQHVLTRALASGALLTVLVGLISCAGLGENPNPPASKLEVSAVVLDHENADRTPSASTFLAITLKSVAPDGRTYIVQEGSSPSDPSVVCDGVSMSPTNILENPSPVVPSESYMGIVPARSQSYACTYFWNSGKDSAVVTIPVMIRSRPRIQSPATDAKQAIPDPGGAGVTVTYANAGNSGVSVTGIAGDFNRHTATSSAISDAGSITIGPGSFPPAFSIGWGTLGVRRSASNVDIASTASNSAFASVHLALYEQVAEIPVFWL